MRTIIGFIAVLLFLFYSPFVRSIFATAPTITVYPTGALNLDNSFTITATMSGLSKNSTYRLRIAAAQQGASNYFGSTYDRANWHMGSITDGNFVNVTTDGNGAWGGDVQGKIDSNDPNFTTGSGTYDLKIGRYTETGTTATWSDPVSISITVPPTPTPTPTSTPTPTPTPTSTPAPTSTPSNTPTPTKTLTPTPTLKPSVSPMSKGTSPTDVLGESTQSGLLSSQTDGVLPNEEDVLASDTTKKPDTVFQIISMALGIVFIVICVILTIRIVKKGELAQNEEE